MGDSTEKRRERRERARAGHRAPPVEFQYETEIEGRKVTVKRYAAGLSTPPNGPQFPPIVSEAEKEARKLQQMADYSPQFELWSEGIPAARKKT